MSRTKPSAAAFAWAVHAFTASGAAIALIALLAVERGAFGAAFAWLALALFVDGIDGTLARAARTKELAGRVDGDVLDLVIDYLTYVFVPGLLLIRAELLPPALAPWAAGLILVSALYTFGRTDMKTKDNYFRGFPGLWNLVVFYLYYAQIGQTAGAVIVGVFIVMTFAPVHFVHPFRVRDYGRWLPLLCLFWALATVALIWPGWDPDPRRWLLLFSAVTGLALIALGLIRTARGPLEKK